MLQQPLSDGSILMRATEEDDAEGFVHAVWLFPGVGLMFIDIRSFHWPNGDIDGPNGTLQDGVLLLNYSVTGSCKALPGARVLHRPRGRGKSAWHRS